MPETVELNVTGMSCHHCEMAVSKALKSLDGVVDASADQQAQKAVVTIEPGRVSREAMIEAIKKEGYQAE